MVLFGLFGSTHQTWAIVTSNAGDSVFNGIDINQLIGADQLYWQGYWGANAVIANVEAGLVWNGHETLTHVNNYFNDPSINVYDPVTHAIIPQFDWHATMVGHVLNGRGWGYGLIINDFNTSTWYGIAPDATLWSGAIATSWNPEPGSDYSGSFNISTQSFVYAYKTAMQTGIGGSGRKADVVNSSWGLDDPYGIAQETMIIDALAYANHTTVVLAAGNHDTGTAMPIGPASGYNSICVAALSSDTSVPPYNAVAPFSNGGPNDYYDPVQGIIIPQSRYRVDIAAPGDNFTLAYYGGTTGGHTSGVDPVNGSGRYYIRDMGGTSFAAPIVAGGAALLVDAGYAIFGGGTSVDGRTIKAVLLNSADKTPTWNNGQSVINGVVTTTQSLDPSVGAGKIDLAKALTQYTVGTTDVPGLHGGMVYGIGWDFGRVASGAPNDYAINRELHRDDAMTVTLSWFVNRAFDDLTQTAYDVKFNDLDLQLWRTENDLPVALVAQSISAYNTVEHLYLSVPEDGNYMLRVLWAGENFDVPGGTPNSEDYAIAWAVPEPSILAMLAMAGIGSFLLWVACPRLRRHVYGKSTRESFSICP
jgi:hypothetical protein